MRKVLSIIFVALIIVTLNPPLANATNPPGNLTKNEMFSQDWIPVGGPNIVPVYWGTYVINGNPQFGHHLFEFNGNNLQIMSPGPAFTAGVYQEINGVTPGATYYGHVGTASSWAGSGDRGPAFQGKIGRQIGIDPYGGTDARSPNIVWGSDVWDNGHWNFDDDPNANAPKVWAVAQGTKITLFLKAMYPQSGSTAQAWFTEAVVVRDPSKPIQPIQPPATPTPAPTPIPVVAKPIRPELDYDMAKGHFYRQASGEPETGRGFAVTNDSDIPFYSEFQRLGGVDGVGYPTSRRFVWNGYVVQIMQKVVFQWRPEVGQVYFVNIFDEMSKAGKDDWLSVVRTVPEPADTAPDQGLTWDQIVNRHIDMLNGNPAIKAVYVGDSDPINHFGLPLSYVDLPNVAVVRAQRAVFQQWKSDVPWAKAGQVTIANGGDVAKEAGMFGPEITTPEEPPA